MSAALGQSHRRPSRYAFLDCVECHTPRLIFEHAIYQLRNPPPTQDKSQRTASTQAVQTEEKEAEGSTGSRKRKRASAATDGLPEWDKCENINEFVEWCRRICDTKDNDDNDDDDTQQLRSLHQRPANSKQPNETRYLVLDRAERLRDTAPTLIPVLMRLQELVRYYLIALQLFIGSNMCPFFLTVGCLAGVTVSCVFALSFSVHSPICLE